MRTEPWLSTMTAMHITNISMETYLMCFRVKFFFKVTPMALKGQLCTLNDFKDTLLALSQAQICILKHSIPVTSECTVVLFSESVLGDTKIEKEKDR